MKEKHTKVNQIKNHMRRTKYIKKCSNCDKSENSIKIHFNLNLSFSKYVWVIFIKRKKNLLF